VTAAVGARHARAATAAMVAATYLTISGTRVC